MLSLLLAAVVGQTAMQPNVGALPLVEQSVECVSVAHLDDGVRLVFFWARVQGEWTCLDHRWATTGMALSRQADEWLLSWPDENENCFRVVRTRCWVESWEPENPLTEQNQRPWFRQLLNPGLVKPR